MNWASLLLYAGPLSVLVCKECMRIGMKPYLPVLGLVLGILLEMKR